MKIKMFDMNFENVDLNKAAKMVVSLVSHNDKALVVTPNVDHIVCMQNDAEMKDVFQRAKYRFCDSMPLRWLSNLIYKKEGLRERVTGADLIFEVSKVAAQEGVTVFYAGGEEGVAEKAAESLKKLYPTLLVAGTYCPPWGFEKDQVEIDYMVSMINNSDAKILFLGVGTPKQEKWAMKNLDALQCNAILGVGAAFDFAAGNLTRAPTFLQNIGLEWLWRLAHEPRRLGRRYIVRGSRFFLIALQEYRKIRNRG